MVDAPTKKLPFKATALSRNKAPKPAAHDDEGDDNNNGDDGLDLFRQSKKMAPILAAEQEKKAKKRQKQLEEQRRRSIAEGKRPAVEQDGPAPVDSSSPAISAREIVSTSPPSKRSAPLSDSPSSKRQRSDADVGRAPAPEPAPRAQPLPFDPTDIVRESIHESIVLSDSDDAVRKAILVMATSLLKRQAESESESESDSASDVKEEEDDDEFEEYVRKAEEQRRRNDALQSETGQEPKRAVTELMVTSVMPGTYMARMKYQFDRPLRLVRDSWIGMQRTKGVTLPECDDDIMLTWQRRRVYATSTLLSLGIRPRGDGRIVVDGQGGGAGLMSDGSKVHLEAWTKEAYTSMVVEEERRQRREAGHVSDDEGGEGEDEAEPVRLRVRLRARELAEVRLTVVSQTTVETLVNGFRRERGVATERDVGIYFDGERLEEHDTMESAGVEDMDTLEVHIK